ncbi:MAG: hypothetical protein M3Q63_01450 [bacterium]|nr:hypothetical protein [bacterium]
MEHKPESENFLENLVNKHVYTHKPGKDIENKKQDIVLKAKVLRIEDGNLVVEYTGNENLLFDGNIESLSLDDVMRLNHENTLEVYTEEQDGPLNMEGSKVGEWLRDA